MEDGKLLYIIAKNIKKYRKMNNMTQEALANASNLAVRHIQKIESATLNITVSTLNKISSALNISPSDLLK
ncbi:MAG TPA: helix-turn-helix transcriptional regulator [Clostridiales bacterium]|jgi:transcriptional regulator with XRE-family HTH domain|nr:helix-turn-helix transcriptional regulator [Clostridiales bacterium]